MVRKLVKWLDYAAARLRARRHARMLLETVPARRVLVICYGNIYRSPFVAGRLQKVAGRDLEIRSAGFHHREGRTVDPDFIGIARDFGVDLSAHRSRLLRGEDLRWADLVLIMDGHNYRLMHHHYPEALTKTFWLGAVSVASPVLIEDPYRCAPGRQREIASQLDAACAELLKRLNATAAAS